jgi:hypothetical protein
MCAELARYFINRLCDCSEAKSGLRMTRGNRATSSFLSHGCRSDTLTASNLSKPRVSHDGLLGIMTED